MFTFPGKVEEVESNIYALESNFGDLVKKAVNLLKKFKTEIEDIVYELSTLSVREKSEHKVFLEANLKKLRKSEDHVVLFGYLNLYWTYLSPHLLKHLVNKLPPLNEIKGDMEAYMKSLHEFRVQTPVTLFCQADKQHVEPPEEFTRVVAKFEKVKTSNELIITTLQDIEEFRQKYGSRHQLRNFALMLNEVEENCFLVTFFVPQSVVEELQSNVPEQLLKEYEVTKLEVSGTCVFIRESLLTEGFSSEEPMDTTFKVVEHSETVETPPITTAFLHSQEDTATSKLSSMVDGILSIDPFFSCNTCYSFIIESPEDRETEAGGSSLLVSSSTNDDIPEPGMIVPLLPLLLHRLSFIQHRIWSLQSWIALPMMSRQNVLIARMVKYTLVMILPSTFVFSRYGECSIR